MCIHEVIDRIDEMSGILLESVEGGGCGEGEVEGHAFDGPLETPEVEVAGDEEAGVFDEGAGAETLGGRGGGEKGEIEGEEEEERERERERGEGRVGRRERDGEEGGYEYF